MGVLLPLPLLLAVTTSLLLLLLHGDDNHRRCCCQAFAPHPTTTSHIIVSRRRRAQLTDDHGRRRRRRIVVVARRIDGYSSAPSSIPAAAASTTTTTALRNGVIIDVSDNFFTSAFFSIGLFYSLGKAYNRYLLEEIAFERRKLEARERKLEEMGGGGYGGEGGDETSSSLVTELDLRRMESAKWLSVYGRKYRGVGETIATAGRDVDGDATERVEGGGRRRRGRRTGILDRDDDEDDDDGDDDGGYEYDDDDDDGRPAPMTDDEIREFENANGVEYDPYYDEPYAEDELPRGKYKEDKSYGDRRYENGEIFYREGAVYYRQGSRPRQKKFWDLNAS